MFKTQDGQILPSVVMIDQEPDTLYFFRKVFHNLPDIKFFTMNEPNFGVVTAAQYQADVIITEIYYPRYELNEGELLIEQLKAVCPDAKIIVYSTHYEEGIIYKYTTVFGVEAYLKKVETSVEDLVRKVYELLGLPCPI